MTARVGQVFKAQPLERAALDEAQARYIAWKRDWHDDGASFDPKALAALRKATRAFHKALAPLLGPEAINGTRARLLCRMQELHHFQRFKGDYYDDLRAALFTAYVVDGACARDVRSSRKADELARTWIWFAADEWQIATGKAPTTGRFAAALLNHRDSAVPGIGGIDKVKAELATWRQARKGQ